MGEQIPESHLDLLIEPVDGVLTTMMPDGQPQMSIVQADIDGQYLLINITGREFRASLQFCYTAVWPYT